MKFYSIPFSLILLLLMASSCQKVINLKLDNAPPQLVIEGNLTNRSNSQIITLSQTVPFSSSNVFPPVTGAQVTVADTNGRTVAFAEGVPGTYTASFFTGRAGMRYTMNVLYGNKTYTATSTLPPAVRLDSISAKNSVFNGNASKDITVFFLDPLGVPNQYRFVLYVNDVEIKRVFTFNDNFFDGRYVNLDLFEDDVTIKSQDIVRVEMQCIDANIYTYWYSLEQQQPDGPGGGTTPSNPPSNINNNALGYFSAHTSQVYSILVN